MHFPVPTGFSLIKKITLISTSTEDVRKPLAITSILGYILQVSGHNIYVVYYNRHITKGYSLSRLSVEIIVDFCEYLHVIVGR